MGQRQKTIFLFINLCLAILAMLWVREGIRYVDTFPESWIQEERQLRIMQIGFYAGQVLLMFLFITSIIGLARPGSRETLLMVHSYLLGVPAVLALLYGFYVIYGLYTGGEQSFGFGMDLWTILIIGYIAYLFRSAVFVKHFPKSKVARHFHWMMVAVSLLLMGLLMRAVIFR